MDDQLKQASEILNQGGIVIFPTDTAFGIGCRIDNEKAIQKLFKIRKRPQSQATPVLINSRQMAQNYLLPIPPAVINNLINQYWPGALTIILPSVTEKVPSLVRGGSGTLGLRMPNHRDVSVVIKSVKVPILGPSANFHGEKTPYHLEDLDQDLVKQVDFVVKGECILKQPSTVIDCTVTPWQIVRQGAVEIDQNFLK